MITVICGDDSISSRNYITSLKKTYTQQNFSIINLTHSQFNFDFFYRADNYNLFGTRNIYFIDNLSSLINKKHPVNSKLFTHLINSKTINLYDWEDTKPAYRLKFPPNVIIKEFKLPQTVFNIIENCYPSNLSQFLLLLKSTDNFIEDGLIFSLLARNIRNLILIKSGQRPKKLVQWQIWKLEKQAQHWSLDQLLQFYTGLARIDKLTKTSANPYLLRQSLDILAYYLL